MTKDDIVAKSIEILNRDGIDGLTMRLLAKSLDIKASSLYWHFKDKAELFAEISEALCGKISLLEDPMESREFLSDVFHKFREALLSVRDSVIVFQKSTPFTPKRMEIVRAVSKALLAIGVKPEDLVTVSNMFNNYVLSFAADEYRFMTVTGASFDEFAARLDPQDRRIFTVPHDFDAQFDYGLTILFSGLIAEKSPR